MSLLSIAPLDRDLTGAALPIPPVVKEAVKLELARFFWRYYLEHEKDVVFRRKVFLFTASVTVKDLRGVWVMLFGEMPSGLLVSSR